MAHTTWRVACALVALVLAVGSCGDDSKDDGGDGDGGAVPSVSDPPTGTDEGDGVDPCELLTAEEVGDAFGTAVVGEPDDLLSTDFQQVCNWSSEDATVGIQVLVIEPGPQADFDFQRESTVEVLGDPDAVEDVEVPGADRAFTLDGLVYAMEIGDHYVQVSNTSIGDASDPEATAGLAALVAGRV